MLPDKITIQIDKFMILVLSFIFGGLLAYSIRAWVIYPYHTIRVGKARYERLSECETKITEFCKEHKRTSICRQDKK